MQLGRVQMSGWQMHLHVLCGGGAVGVDTARLDGCIVGCALLATVRGHHNGLACADLLQQLPLLRRQIVLVHVITLAAHGRTLVQIHNYPLPQNPQEHGLQLLGEEQSPNEDTLIRRHWRQ